MTRRGNRSMQYSHTRTTHLPLPHTAPHAPTYSHAHLSRAFAPPTTLTAASHTYPAAHLTPLRTLFLPAPRLLLAPPLTPHHSCTACHTPALHTCHTHTLTLHTCLPLPFHLSPHSCSLTPGFPQCQRLTPPAGVWAWRIGTA